MKNELGNIPKVSLDDDDITEEDKLQEKVENTDSKEEKPKTVEQTIPDLPDKEVAPVLETSGEVKFPANNMDDNVPNYYSKQDKMNKFLTIVLIISISIVVLIALFFGIKKLVNHFQARKTAEENRKLAEQIKIEEGPGQTIVDGDGNPIIVEDPGLVDGTGNRNKEYYKGFEVVGYIRIPRTGINYPILRTMTNKSLEASVAMEHTMTGINKPGNTTISGHNYRDDQFFAKNYLIQLGDAIYIKDMTGKELKYDVYDIKELTENDKSFVQRNTNGAIEVTISTCTDNVVNRIVIFAKHNPNSQDNNTQNEEPLI